MLGRMLCSSFFHFSCTLDATWKQSTWRLLNFVDDHATLWTRSGVFFDMGNGSSKYSSRPYDYRPFTGPVIPPPSQMAHENSYASGSTMPSYDMPRKKRRKWYQFGTGRERHRGQEVWYSAYVSPRGQQPPTPNPYGQCSLFIQS